MEQDMPDMPSEKYSADYTLFDLLDERAKRHHSPYANQHAIEYAAQQCIEMQSNCTEKRYAPCQFARAETFTEARARAAIDADIGASKPNNSEETLDTRDLLYTCAHCKVDIETPFDPHSLLPEELFYMVGTVLDSHSALHRRGDLQAPTNPNNIFCTSDCLLAAYKIRAPNLPIILYIEHQINEIRRQKLQLAAAAAGDLPQ